MERSKPLQQGTSAHPTTLAEREGARSGPTKRSTAWTYPEAIAADCDETLTTGGKLLPSVLLARERLRSLGIPLIVVTGRAAGFAWTVFELLDAEAVVAENGGLLFERAQPETPILVSAQGPTNLETGGWQPGRALFEKLQSEGGESGSDGQRFAHLKPTLDVAFRMTDFTFLVGGLRHDELVALGQRVRGLGAEFTFSTIHAHIMPQGQDKAGGLKLWAKRHGVSTERILTIGDSPNDESLFDPGAFQLTWGVAGISKYADIMRWRPRHVTAHAAGQGFAEMACRVTGGGSELLAKWIALDEGWTHIVFIDGACPVCTQGARRLVRREALPEQWRFAPLQGETALRLLPDPLRSNAANPDARPDALVVWSEGRLLVGADAVLVVLEAMGGFGAALARILHLVPRSLREFGYRSIARLRFFLPSDAQQHPQGASCSNAKRWLP